MSATYKIIGDDGREYGPATAEQIRQWAAEGRVEKRTPIFADGAKDWNFVGLLPEFAGLFAASGAPPPIAPPPPGNSTAGQMPRTNTFAISGMVCGILSLTLCWCCGGFPFNVLGLVFSVVALFQINEKPQFQKGCVLAVAGIVLAAISFILFLALLVSGHAHLNIYSGQQP